ncbi:transposase [Pseudomonas sp. FSL R10-1350]|uniref:transposase domain-containing protein n=1 Tax=Pseudomonas sp. FSL R10-1350 TaxID=2662197 RepID=UPI001296B47C|nr:transposase domain-containing protein [Pseudomonas sp. FSL R10-1350]MQU65704.1 transposase [Pseudomonas sp. FSL R10-1350]
MSVQQDLLDLGDLFNFSDLSTFTQNIPVEWVASALDLSAQASIRRRRLPIDQVLWLVLGMALFRDEPVHEVARRLNICAQGLATDHLLARSVGTNRHWLTPARKNLVSEEIVRYGKHDRLVRMKVSPQARKRNPGLPTHWEVREVSYEIQGKLKIVMTSLPASTYSTMAVAKLYQQRWEIEQGFRDIKSSMQQNAMTLRSKKIDLVYQEVWGLLLAYNVIRREASQAAVAFGRVPSDIRFKPACQYIAVQLIVMAAANPISATGRRLAELRAGVGGMFLDRRPRPSRLRTVKISKTRFPVDRKAAPLK